MPKKKDSLMYAISAAILRLRKLEKSSHNSFTKKEIQEEIENLVFVMVQLPEFLSFLLDKLLIEEQTRSAKPKTGPLGNPIKEKLEKVTDAILGKDDNVSNK